MRVRDVMTPTVYTVAPTDTVGTARELFKRYEIDQLVVTQRRTVVGIAADRDLRNFGDDAKVAEAMVRHVTTIGSDETLRRAAGMMAGHAIGSLPVVDDGNLVGIVTTADLLRLISKGATHPAPSRERRVLAKREPNRRPAFRSTEVNHVVQRPARRGKGAGAPSR